MITLQKNLATRISARNLFEKMRKEKDYELDFRNVVIASRSFTNELVKLEKKHKIKTGKRNMNEDVRKMFRIAGRPLNLSILKGKKQKITSIDKYADALKK